jgi:cell pole-organizing protein PopZ
MGSAGLKVNEPSMEEILASIRRIIADDRDAPEYLEEGDVPSSPLKNVLDLTERHVSPVPQSEMVVRDEREGDLPARPEDDSNEDHPSVEAVSFEVARGHEVQAPAYQAIPLDEATPVSPLAQPCGPACGEALLSEAAQTAVSSAFGRLEEVRAPSQSQTVEGLMKELLRPMLKAWLDDNLPPLVERLVQAEIERVTRGRG